MIRAKRGRWEVVVYYGRDAAGRRRAKSKMAPTERAARTLEREMLNERDAGRRVTGARATVGDLIDRWLDTAQVEESTRYQARRRLERYVRPELGKTRLDRLASEDLDVLYARLVRGDKRAKRPAVSPNTVRRVHGDLRSVLNLAVRYRWIARNPALDARPPGERMVEPEVPDVAHVAAFLGALEHGCATHGPRCARPQLGVFLRLVAVTGMRRGEACALRRGDVDAERGVVRVQRALGQGEGAPYVKPTKTRRRNALAIDAETARLLAEHLKVQSDAATECALVAGDGAYVFSFDPAGEAPWRPDWTTKTLRRFRDAHPGLDGVTLRQLRHWMVTAGFDAGFSPKVVAGRATHARPSVTLDRYAAHLPVSDRALADHLADLVTAADREAPRGRRAIRESE